MRAASKYYNQYTCPAGTQSSRFAEDEKYIQEKFNDKRIKLRWDYLGKKCAVWYEAPSGLYCVHSIDPPYNIYKAIKSMEARQRTGKQMAAEYKKHSKELERRSDDKIAQVAGEIASVADKRRKGLITVSG